MRPAKGGDELPELPIGEDPIVLSPPKTVAEMLAGAGKRFADITEYTSYEVTVHLNGKQRTYRALALYHTGNDENWSYQTEKDRSARLERVEILDNVTSEMNTVLKDESPYARSPWEKYSKSTLYLAVAREIRELKNTGKPLIPADVPIGYLPGDNAAPSKLDVHALSGCCFYPGTEQSIKADNYATTATGFKMLIGDPLGTIFNARDVSELAGAQGVNTCYYPGGPTPHYPAVTDTAGESWSVAGGDVYGQTNYWGFDTIGVSTSIVDRIRSEGPSNNVFFPCSLIIYQNMWMSCEFDSGFVYEKNNVLTITIAASNTVTNCRRAVRDSANRCDTINY